MNIIKMLIDSVFVGYMYNININNRNVIDKEYHNFEINDYVMVITDIHNRDIDNFRIGQLKYWNGKSGEVVLFDNENKRHVFYNCKIIKVPNENFSNHFTKMLNDCIKHKGKYIKASGIL